MASKLPLLLTTIRPAQMSTSTTTSTSSSTSPSKPQNLETPASREDKIENQNGGSTEKEGRKILPPPPPGSKFRQFLDRKAGAVMQMLGVI